MATQSAYVCYARQTLVVGDVSGLPYPRPPPPPPAAPPFFSFFFHYTDRTNAVRLARCDRPVLLTAAETKQGRGGGVGSRT